MRDQTLPRLEILLAAATCFMEQGFHATSIDHVARRLKATKGLVYHYFPSKVDLFFAIHREGMDRLFAAVEPALKTQGDGITVLAAMMRAHALAQFENQALESVVVQGVQLHRFGAMTPAQREVLDELIASRDRFEDLFKKAINAAKKDGTLGDLDTSIAVKTLLGGLQWSLIWYRPRGNNSREANLKLADKMVQTLVQGLRAR
jgi:AcrR family transcriptional regulator